MPIYFIRHGQTVANAANVFTGQRLDSPMTEVGLQQVRVAAQALENHGITKIICSNLIRTRKTAHETALILGVNSVEVDNRIIEYDAGMLTGLPLTDIKSVDLIATEGAEDPFAFKERVVSFLRDHKDSSETILMVSHGGVAKIIEACRQGIDPALFFDLPGPSNATVAQLDVSWLI